MMFCTKNLLFWLLVSLLSHDPIAANIPSADPNDATEIICPEMDLHSCYPKTFVPTKEWQVIRPGQVVPEGLHYQMDFETGIRKAKLLDPEDADNSNDAGHHEVAVMDAQDVLAVEQPSDEETDRVFDAVEGEGAKFQFAMKELERLFLDNKIEDISTILKKHPKTIDDILETLIYASHDIKYGEKFVTQPTNLVIFLSIINDPKVKSTELKEKLLRIISNSVRNNEGAIKMFFENPNNSQSVVPNLLRFIDQELVQLNSQNLYYSDQLLIKRTIGIFNALIYQQMGLENVLQHDVKNHLKTRFDLFNTDVKERCVNFFEDLEMIIKELAFSDEL